MKNNNYCYLNKRSLQFHTSTKEKQKTLPKTNITKPKWKFSYFAMTRNVLRILAQLSREKPTTNIRFFFRSFTFITTRTGIFVPIQLWMIHNYFLIIAKYLLFVYHELFMIVIWVGCKNVGPTLSFFFDSVYEWKSALEKRYKNLEMTCFIKKLIFLFFPDKQEMILFAVRK